MSSGAQPALATRIRSVVHRLLGLGVETHRAHQRTTIRIARQKSCTVRAQLFLSDIAALLTIPSIRDGSARFLRVQISTGPELGTVIGGLDGRGLRRNGVGVDRRGAGQTGQRPAAAPPPHRWGRWSGAVSR